MFSSVFRYCSALLVTTSFLILVKLKQSGQPRWIVFGKDYCSSCHTDVKAAQPTVALPLPAL